MGRPRREGIGLDDALKQDSGFRIQDSGFRIQDSGFRSSSQALCPENNLKSRRPLWNFVPQFSGKPDRS
jgi:hypothetical protein